MSENWILHRPPCRLYPRLLLTIHTCKEHKISLHYGIGVPFIFLFQNYQALNNASQICSLSPTYLYDLPHILSLAWQQSFIIKWMEMLSWNLSTVQDNLVSLTDFLYPGLLGNFYTFLLKTPSICQIIVSQFLTGKAGLAKVIQGRSFVCGGKQMFPFYI